MGFLKSLFKKPEDKKEVKELPFKLLKTEEQLDEMITGSKAHLAAIFKHSTRCGTSRMAFRAFRDGFDPDLKNVEVYVLDVLAYRALSDEVAARFQVLHESPQLILIKEGQMVAHYSHYRISPAVLGAYI